MSRLHPRCFRLPPLLARAAGGFRSSCSSALQGMEETPEGLAVAAATREAIKRKKLEQAQRVGDQTAGGSTGESHVVGDGSVLITREVAVPARRAVLLPPLPQEPEPARKRVAPGSAEATCLHEVALPEGHDLEASLAELDENVYGAVGQEGD